MASLAPRAAMRHPWLALLPFSLAGCLQPLPLGPDLGPCAESPEGVHTFGEVGIGTCLAGPTDLAFHQADGRTWLVVSNADPYLNFASGSVLLVDFDAIDLEQPFNRMHELPAHALPTDRFVGSLALVPDRDLLMVTGRLSADARGVEDPDAVWVVDLSDPTTPRPWAAGDRLEVEADPHPLALDPETGLAYVVNMSAATVSVIDTEATPFELVDVAPEVALQPGWFVDGDDSGSQAEIAGLTTLDAEAVRTDNWTLSWVEGTFRLWVPTDQGLQRWNTGLLDYTPSGFGLELDPDLAFQADEIRDPFLGTIEMALAMYFGDQGRIRLAVRPPDVPSWTFELADPALYVGSGWDAWASAPSVLRLDGALTLFYEGRVDEGAIPQVGRATAPDGGAFAGLADPVLDLPQGYEGAGQPFVRPDPFTGGLRMWMSLWDGEVWSIGHATSDTGASWTVAEPLLEVPGHDLAAPVVTWANGRYLLWATLGDGEAWSHVHAWSWDGIEWFDLHEVIDSDQPYDPMHPPRVALQPDPSGGWQVKGASAGPVPGLAVAGTSFSAPAHGFSLRVASGHEIGLDVLDEASANGVVPGSLVVLGDDPVLYVTTLNTDLRPGLAALAWDGEGWEPLAEDLVPAGQGPNVAGARDPVVFGEAGAYTMLFAATGADGITHVHRATSTDGLSWSTQAAPVLPDPEGWASLETRPGAIEVLDDGSLRLWYSGTNGSRWLIGSAISQDGGATFEPEPAEERPWQFGAGPPGDFDHAGVRDPAVVREGDTLHLWYAGFDGSTWQIGHATRPVAGGPWTRRTDPHTGRSRPVLPNLPRTFAAAHTYAPALMLDEDGEVLLLHAGDDGAQPRVGVAIGTTDAVFPAHRFPTVADRLEFRTVRGLEGVTAIDLAQHIDGVTLSGRGISGARLDPERGFLYLPSRQAGQIYVVDVRDDSDADLDDVNHHDLEAVILVTGEAGPRGFRDVLPVPGADLLYATSINPEAVWVFDLSTLQDEPHKRVLRHLDVATIPLPRAGVVAGDEAHTRAIAGGTMALSPDQRFLFVPHFLDNSLLVIDRDRGTHGEIKRRITTIGENPHLVRVSPDGRLAVVANYLGAIEDGIVHSNLAVVDIDPESPTYLEVLTWLVNR